MKKSTNHIPERSDIWTERNKLEVAASIYRYNLARADLCGRILDLGCSYGQGTALLRNKVVGIELSTEALLIAKKWSNNDFLVADAHHLPFKKNSFAGVCCFELIEHVQKPIAVLKEIQRVLKKEGRLILSSPNAKMRLLLTRMGLKVSKNPWHIREFTLEELTSLLIDLGFKIEKIFGLFVIRRRAILPSFLLENLSLGKIVIQLGRCLPKLAPNIIIQACAKEK